MTTRTIKAEEELHISLLADNGLAGAKIGDRRETNFYLSLLRLLLRNKVVPVQALELLLLSLVLQPLLQSSELFELMSKASCFRAALVTCT